MPYPIGIHLWLNNLLHTPTVAPCILSLCFNNSLLSMTKQFIKK
ncbi:hypothetical protein HMPREF9144_1893 [Prevotella pallens ATCC 700821]|uniref:Uncharacterized protein n=1 Tax=Prevotella pallens ATCC 700821 TaxID=997353 RepID=F9DJQ2_9BACT|nr:hypothetical protein HMPREF9144_1893 [Prevotella pallens ATCC 700821]